MHVIRHLGLLSFCLVAACNTTPRLSTQHAVEEAAITDKTALGKHQASAATKAISSWEIKGAMAAKNQAKGWSATLHWVQNGPGAYQIRLMGPLGGGTVLINKSGNTITFKDGKKTTTSTNVDDLLLKQTGIKLPVNNLYYWVRGLAAPGAVQAEKRDGYNHLTELKQSGYLISFAKYSSINGVDLPGMVRLDGNGVMVKVAIRQWRV